jgi:hypothetical protein
VDYYHRYSYSNNIDDLSSHDGIANMFASKYQELYSCVSFNECDMNALKADIVNHMGHEYINSECIVNAGEVGYVMLSVNSNLVKVTVILV